ncbi:pyruvate dehydrogenase E2 component (dihydrolipoamide acetyltransferase) [Brevibacterium siliguriense]|uniref:Dihydrolipoamide acetyltransferase component of pyruvate dehydrogenase complex n=1 Tax=Brevibacterium siliguriense TaxID=1136497 RepID=A0A1H1MFW9_9MICO|nr:dihydrolipoamide acetyltransferase family protein [Brevibacterium siliguriense]SDR85731.1 pyruvate dehydrogenase E2 component (dihydrolipoamide acetyltransferase) [Brevibacterium siliguriense]
MSADLNTGTREFILPDLGEGLTEAELISWKVEIGDEVHVDQMVVEVESAKSVVELPCPYAGRIVSLHANAGDTVSAGQALLSVAKAGVEASAEAESADDSSGESSGANLIGYGTSEPKARSTKKRSFGGKHAAAPDATSTAAPTAAPAVPTVIPAAPPQPPTETPAPAGDSSTVATDRVSPVSSPLVRKLAKDHGISAKHLPGTGPGGVVTRSDVLAAIESGAAAAATRVPSGTSPVAQPHVGTEGTAASASVPVSGTAASAKVPASVAQADRDTRTPITGLRKVVSERLTKSRQEIPEATIWLDVDATELLNTKRALEARTGEKYSLLSLVARFVVAGLKKYPIINSSIDTAAGEIVTHGDINLGLAAQTPRGLMVPVVHGAGEMSLRQLRDSVSETVGKAASGRFDPSELSGGTFTLNNYGVFGVDGSAPIINLPEVAMLGLGRIKDRPWVSHGELTVRKVMYLSFVFDHRACDGQEPSEFLTFVADCIENPISLFPEL